MKFANIAKDIQRTNIDLHNRYINNPIFIPQPLNIDITSPVVAFNNNQEWKIVPVSFLIHTPIIHDVIFEGTEPNKKIIDVSLTFCPYTYTAILYEGTWCMTDKIYNSNIVLENMKEPSMMIQAIGVKTIKKKEILVRKWNTRILTLRRAISEYPDCVYLHNKISEKLKALIPTPYYHDTNILYPLINKVSKYHPKTIVHGIEYRSKGIMKYSVIIGNDASDKPSGLDIYSNKVYEYLEKKNKDLIDKFAIVIPTFWFSWITFHPEAKIIKL